MGLVDIYCVNPITITPKTGEAADGRSVYGGTAVTTTARVNDRSGVLRPDTGREVTYDREIHLKSGETVAAEDKITFDGTDHEVVELVRVNTINGTPDHYKAMVKRIGP